MRAPLDVAATLALASRDITEPSDADETLRTILEVARESMPGIDEVGITLAHRDGGVETRVATGPVVLELDRLQTQLREGPCLHAIEAGPMVRVEHARTDERWPRFMPAAVALGMRSQLGIRLHVDARTMGVLTMYSFSSDTLSEETEQMAELFAAHASLVLGHAHRLGNLSAALDSRKMIGIASVY